MMWIQQARLLLLPVSWLYGGITWLRNKAFDLGWRRVFSIPGKSIVVGNLSVGGTGKTPHVSWLSDRLKSEFSVGVLSRGYGRKTRGFRWVDLSSSAEQVGDEPLSYVHQHHSDIRVAVCERRASGVQRMQAEYRFDVLILDDAYQHRAVRAGMNVLLSDFNEPFFRDRPLPAGNLREFRSGKHRADYLIFTKCPENITDQQKADYVTRAGFPANKVLFSHIQYGALQPILGSSPEKIEHILLVTGIANPQPLWDQLAKMHHVELIQFPDHHAFSEQDIAQIHKKFDTFADRNKIIATTEKDWMRLISFKEHIERMQWPLFVQYMSVKLDRENEWLEEIKRYVRTI